MAETMKIVIEVDGKNAKATINGVEDALKNVGTQAGSAADSIAKTESSLSSLVKGGLAVAGVVLSFEALKSAITSTAAAGLDMDSIMSKLSVGGQNAANQFAFVSEVSNRLGINIKEAATQYGALSAAANGTALQGEGARKVFEGMATAASAMHMSNEQLGGSLLALQQMISKGKVSAEELNGQLGERMPGAMQIAARAMGMTTQELMKMMADGKLLAEEFLPKLADEMKLTFGETAVTSADSARAAFNRFENAVFTAQTKIADNGMLEILAGLADVMTASIDVFIGKTEEAGTAVDEFKRQSDLRTFGHEFAHYAAVMADITRIAANEFIIAASAAAELAQAVMLVAKVIAFPLDAKKSWEEYKTSINELNTSISNAVDGISNSWKITDAVDKSFKDSEQKHKESFDKKIKRENDFIEEANKIAAKYGTKQGAAQEIQKVAQSYGGEIKEQFGGTPAPVAAGEDAATIKKQQQIAKQIEAEKFKYHQIAEIANTGDAKGLERLDAKFAIEMEKMARDREKAIEANAWNDETETAFSNAMLAKAKEHEDAKAKILDDSAKQLQAQSFASQQSAIANQVAANMADQSILLSAIESDRAIRQAQGTWTLENEDNFQQQKQDIELGYLEQNNALKADSISIGLANELTAIDDKYQKQIDLVNGNEAAVAQVQAQWDAAKLNAQIQAEKKTDAIDQQNLNKKRQFAIAQANIEKQANDARLSLATGAMGALSSLLANGGKESFEISKVLAIAETTLSTYAAAQKAYESQLAIPTPDAPFRAELAAGIAIANGLARVAAISSTSYGGGGGGGVSNVGSGGSISATPSSQANAGGYTGNIAPAPTQQQQPVQVSIYNSGNVMTSDFVSNTIIPQIKDAITNADVLIIDPRSRQAAVIQGA